MQFTLTPSHVQHHAASLLRSELRLKDFGACCPVATLLAVVFAACCRLGSLFAAARRLAAAPSHETVRQALLYNLSDLDTLERRLNRALTADLPRGLTRRRQHMASDLTLLPYHGRHAHDPRELVRGQAKSGTTHFHAYATAYVVLRGQRFTVALTYVRQGEKSEKVLRRLLQRCAQVGVRPKLLLLDRGFWSVGVLRYLQAARYPFLMPAIGRGRKASHPKGPGGTRVFWSWRRGGWGQYTLQETGQGRKATVSICVHVRPRAGRRGKHGREHLVYAYWGWKPSPSPRAVSERYRGRFGIETSYRQMNQGRARTCTRNPAVRLFLVGVALLLRNLWVWLHHEVLSTPRRGRRRYRLERLRFKDLLLMLLHEAERALGVCDDVFTERPIPIEVGTTARPRAG
jgi:Transposase DDE domain